MPYPARQLLEAAVKAADAASEYDGSAATVGRDLDYLNEQWAQSYIGFALNDALRRRHADKRELYVTFETNAAFIGSCYRRQCGRPAGKITPQQRFDCLLWANSGSPLAVVEVKDRPSMGLGVCLDDPTKIPLLRWNPMLSFGLFIFSVRSNSSNLDAAKVRLQSNRDRVFDAA